MIKIAANKNYYVIAHKREILPYREVLSDENLYFMLKFKIERLFKALVKEGDTLEQISKASKDVIGEMSKPE
jgi:hypothetical protein